MTTTTTGPAAGLLLRALAAAACVSAAACGGSSTATTTASPDVWAVVDGREIRRDEVEMTYRRAAPQTPAPSDDEVLAAKLSVVDQLIDQEILLGRARALNLDVTGEELEKAFTERKGNMTEEAFQKELTQRRVTVDDMKQGLRRELIVQKLVDQEISAKVTIGDQEIRDFYEQNRAQFNVAETQYRIAQLIITPVREPQLRNRRNDDATTPAEAQRKLEMLTEQLRNGADFATLAMDYSEDPQSAPQGGDLGFIPVSALSQVPPRMREVVLKTDPGNVSTVSAGGAHTIVLVMARENAGQRDLGTPAVRDGISTLLRQRKEQVLRAAYISAARDRVTVVNHLARMIVDAGGAPPGLAPGAPGR